MEKTKIWINETDEETNFIMHRETTTSIWFDEQEDVDQDADDEDDFSAADLHAEVRVGASQPTRTPSDKCKELEKFNKAALKRHMGKENKIPVPSTSKEVAVRPSGGSRSLKRGVSFATAKKNKYEGGYGIEKSARLRRSHSLNIEEGIASLIRESMERKWNKSIRPDKQQNKSKTPAVKKKNEYVR